MDHTYLKEHLQQLEQDLLKTEIRQSKERLSEYLSPSFFEIGSSGKTLYKERGIATEGLRVVKMGLSNFEIYPLSENIVLATYKIFDEISKQTSLRSSIWKRENGKWKMQFHQGTKVL